MRLNCAVWDWVYTEVVVGDCPTGLDKCVREWCPEARVFEADWEAHGKAAGPIRNRKMVQAADLLVAFWDGKSQGTLSAIREAARAGVPVRIFSASF